MGDGSSVHSGLGCGRLLLLLLLLGDGCAVEGRRGVAVGVAVRRGHWLLGRRLVTGRGGGGVRRVRFLVNLERGTILYTTFQVTTCTITLAHVTLPAAAACAAVFV